MARAKDGKAVALGRAETGLMTAEDVHRMAVELCGVTDADLKTAGARLIEALDAERVSQQGIPMADWPSRLKAIELIFGVRGVKTAASTHNTGSGQVVVNVNLPSWASAEPEPVVIDVEGAQPNPGYVGSPDSAQG